MFYAGQNCQFISTVQTFCLADSCLNGGTCVEQIGTYRCECPVGLTGQHCQTNVDDCQQDSCLNGGTCLDELDAFSCLCTTGFEGNQTSILVLTHIIIAKLRQGG